MTRIDFAFGAPHRLRTTCEVVHRHYLAGRRLLVFCSDAQRLALFDQLLWGFDPQAFVPHVAIGDPLAAQTPVLLCDAAGDLQALDDTHAQSWLVNLDDACPPDFSRFPRLLEIVSADPPDRQAARERWKYYVAQGLAPKAHDISGRQ